MWSRAGLQKQNVFLARVQKLWGLRTKEKLSKLYKKNKHYRNPGCTNFAKFRFTDLMVIQWLAFPATRGTRGLQSCMRQSLHPCQIAKRPFTHSHSPTVPKYLKLRIFPQKNSSHFYSQPVVADSTYNTRPGSCQRCDPRAGNAEP